MPRYVNTALGSSMLPDGRHRIRTLSTAEATAFLTAGPLRNVCNPNHRNTLDAVSRVLGVDLRAAEGGRVALGPGDHCLVVEIAGLPRETREFTDAEVAAAQFRFRLVEMEPADAGPVASREEA